MSTKTSESSTYYGSIGTDEARLMANKAGEIAITEAKLRYEQLRVYAEEGEWTWKLAGFLAGLLIVATSALSLLSHFFGLSWFSALIDIYLILFGSIACVLEYKDALLTAQFRTILKREALFIYRPYGRAAFYFFVGLLMVGNGGLLGILVGAFTILVGVIIFTASRTALASMEQMRGRMTSEKDVATQFAVFDADKSGGLDPSELAKMCKALGCAQSLNELEAVLCLLDKDSDGKVSYEEFLDWWRGREDHFV